MVDIDLRLKLRYLKLELKVLVGYLFCDLIVWSPYTDNGSAEIRRSYRALGTVELKITQRYLDFLNHATFSEGVECIFGFNNKCFCVARDDLNHLPM